MENHVKDYDIDLLNAKVESIEKKDENNSPLYIVKTAGKKFKTKTIIFATGTKIKRLGVKGEKEFENKGVSYCALCDGPLFKNKIVGVVGGSDSAVKEALLLTEYAKKVFIIYRGEQIHPEQINLARAEEKIKWGKIEVINHTNVLEIKGAKFIKSVVLDKAYKGKRELLLEGLFVEIGHLPLSELAVPISVRTNEKGEIVINRNSETNIEGIFAAGDVVDTEFKQAITGVGEGVTAVYHAYKFVRKSGL